MIDYDSFSLCHLTDIFFPFHAGARELKDMKAIFRELQDQLVVTDIGKTKLKKVGKNEQTFKRKVWKLKENKISRKSYGIG